MNFFIQIENTNLEEYEVPIEIKRSNQKAKNPRYEVTVDNDNFSFKIIRKSTGTVL